MSLKSNLKSKGFKMDNIILKNIANRIRFNWDMLIKDEDEIRRYASNWGYQYSTAESFIFDEYLENFCDKGKINSRFYSLVDETVDDMGIVNELSELDYQMVWGYLNQDIDNTINANRWCDAVGLSMIQK